VAKPRLRPDRGGGLAPTTANLSDMTDPLRYAVILESDEDTVRVIVPAFPEIHTFGIDRDDALRMAKDAIQLSIEYRREKGLDVPGADADSARLEIVTVAA
jgi:predicted RNase H-like HicB family nuclease